MSASEVASVSDENSDPAHTPQLPLARHLRPTFEEFASDVILAQSGYGHGYTKMGYAYGPMNAKPGGGWYCGDEAIPYLLKRAEIKKLYNGSLVYGWRIKPGGQGNALAILDIDFHDKPQPNAEMHTLGMDITALLVAAGLPARYISVSSTNFEYTSRGLHIHWMCTELISYEYLEKLVAVGLSLVKPLVELRASMWGTTVEFDAVPGKTLFIRFPLSAHPKEPRGSEPVSFGPRLSACDVVRLSTFEPSPQQQSRKTRQNPPESGQDRHPANAYNGISKANTNTLSAFPPIPRDGSLRQAAGDLIQNWKRVIFARGESNDLLQSLGSDCFRCGLPIKENGGCTADRVISFIISLAVQKDHWHCEASPYDVADRAYRVFESLFQRGEYNYGEWLAPEKSLPISMGVVKALCDLPLEERAILWGYYIHQQIHLRERLEVPQTHLTVYMDLATGKTTKTYDTKKVRHILKKHLVQPGVASLIQPYTLGVRADSYKVSWPDAWSKGEIISQEEAEDMLGLPHIYGLLPWFSVAWNPAIPEKIGYEPKSGDSMNSSATSPSNNSTGGSSQSKGENDGHCKTNHHSANYSIKQPKTPLASSTESLPENAEQTLSEILIKAKEELCTVHS